MKCFTHRNADAVAVCRSCGRALCPDCIAEVGLACACKNRCETDVARFHAMVTQGRSGPGSGAIPPTDYFRVVFLLVLGMAFIWFGLHFFADHGINWFFVAMGLAFFLFGVSQYYMNRKMRKFFCQPEEIDFSNPTGMPRFVFCAHSAETDSNPDQKVFPSEP